MAKIRVLVADDSLVVRRVVTEELAAQPDIEVVGAAINGKSAVEKFAQLNPDLVILDIEMPEMDGIEATARIAASHPETSVLALSAYDDDQYVQRLIEDILSDAAKRV